MNKIENAAMTCKNTIANLASQDTDICNTVNVKLNKYNVYVVVMIHLGAFNYAVEFNTEGVKITGQLFGDHCSCNIFNSLRVGRYNLTGDSTEVIQIFLENIGFLCQDLSNIQVSEDWTELAEAVGKFIYGLLSEYASMYTLI